MKKNNYNKKKKIMLQINEDSARGAYAMVKVKIKVE